ncbi:hypothetical protein EYF80_044547 [Liparis tanakae]|uniref:Uncharacterized protein n=1 Tax=Liparis tanakae TaxID=230148 RepID=A0A4Z2FVL8_9TELE|nr:hypothetical protein EYF80_044547 [Liparis tanakae]
MLCQKNPDSCSNTAATGQNGRLGRNYSSQTAPPLTQLQVLKAQSHRAGHVMYPSTKNRQMEVEEEWAGHQQCHGIRPSQVQWTL